MLGLIIALIVTIISLIVITEQQKKINKLQGKLRIEEYRKDLYKRCNNVR